MPTGDGKEGGRGKEGREGTGREGREGVPECPNPELASLLGKIVCSVLHFCSKFGYKKKIKDVW